jgi:putative oxidoreductase
MEGMELTYLFIRILICGCWIMFGLFKLTHYKGFTEKLAGFGFPAAALFTPLVILTELGGSILIIARWFLIPVAIWWIVFTLWASWVEHRHVIGEDGAIDFHEYVQVGKNISIIGGLLLLILFELNFTGAI